MALKLHATYPGRFDSPSENYPQGKWRNRSNSTAHDGGYLEEKHMNDVYGFFGALLHNAEMTPNGEVDTAKKSQFYEALVTVAKSVVGEEGYATESYVNTAISKIELTEYRKLDNHRFDQGWIAVRAKDNTGSALNLECQDGFVKGSVAVDGEGNLSLNEYSTGSPFAKTFTFPSEGGEIALKGQPQSRLNDVPLLLANATHEGNYVRKGLSPNNVIQSYAVDNFNRLQFTQHITKTGSVDGSEISVINVYDLDGGSHSMRSNKGDYDIGHQGLAVQNMPDGTSKLWSSRRYSNSSAGIVGDYGNYAVRFNADFEDEGEITGKEYFKFFNSGNIGQSSTPAISKDGSLLAVKLTKQASREFVIRVFKTEDLVTGGDYSNRFYKEFSVFNVVNGSDVLSFQSMLLDHDRVTILATAQDVATEGYLYTFDFDGKLLSKELFEVGIDQAREEGAGTFYEPEGSAWYYDAVTGSFVPRIQIAMGDGGSRVCAVYSLGRDTSTMYFGDYPDSYTPSGISGLTVSHKDGRASISVVRKGSGAGSALNLVKRREKSTALGSGEEIGVVRFLGDNGEQDWGSATQGVVAASVGSRVQGAVVDGILKGSLDFSTRGEDGLKIRWRVTQDGKLLSMEKGQPIGGRNYEVEDIYLKNQPTVTSDAKAKLDIEDIDEKYMRVLSRLKFKQFKLRSGTSGRTHFGIIAQEWIEACEAEGVDPKESGILVGNETEGYAIRYNELQILFNAYILHKLNL